MKPLYFFLGFLSLALGLIGIFVPVMPTAPFVICAAWCFAKCSPRFHSWMIHHRVFGPLIQDWNARGAIPARAKAIAIPMMSVSMAIIWWRVDNPYVLYGVSAFLVGAAFFVWSRPS